MAAAVNGQGSSFDVGAVRRLFEARPKFQRYPYDVSADGEHFLVNTLIQDAAQMPITLVVNWTAALKK